MYLPGHPWERKCEVYAVMLAQVKFCCQLYCGLYSNYSLKNSKIYLFKGTNGNNQKKHGQRPMAGGVVRLKY